MAQLFPHQYRPGPLKMDQPAVYKLHVGSKYFIWKGKTLKGSIDQTCKDIYKYRWRVDSTGHLFSPIVTYIRTAKVIQITVEVVRQTADPHELLEAERDLLQAGKEDPACLNTVFEAHIPKWLQGAIDNVPVKPLTKRSSTRKATTPPTENKADTATFSASVGKLSDRQPVIPPAAAKKDTGRLSKLKEALKKLDDGESKNV